MFFTSGFLETFLRGYNPLTTLPERAAEAAILRGCTNIKIKELAEDFGYSYGTLRGYLVREETKRLIEEAQKAFVDAIFEEARREATKYWEKAETPEDLETPFDPTKRFGDCKIYGAEIRHRLGELVEELMSEAEESDGENLPILLDTAATLLWITRRGNKSFNQVRELVWDQGMPRFLKRWTDEVREKVEEASTMDRDLKEELLDLLTLIAEYLEIVE